MFKVGDKVVCTQTHGDQFTKGKLYIITAVNEATERLFFAVDDRGSHTNGWGMKFFRPINSFFFVYAFGLHGPQVKHKTYESALAEAKRLAAIKPDQVYMVLECKAEVSLPRVEPQVKEYT